MSTAESTYDPRPGSGAVWLTGMVALVAVGASAVNLPGTVVGLVGTVGMVAGVSRANRRVHTLGTMALFGGVLVAGVSGAPPVLVVVGAAATVVAWDAGENAIGLGHQLGRRADTSRVAYVHVGATATVAVVVAVLAVVTFRMASSGQPSVASLLLLVAAVLFTWLLDR